LTVLFDGWRNEAFQQPVAIRQQRGLTIVLIENKKLNQAFSRLMGIDVQRVFGS
jgi:hypothetical protein